MTASSRTSSRLSSVSNWIKQIPWLLIPILALSLTTAFAQQLTGTISGTVTDQTGAVIPGAKVTIISEGTGDHRESKSDGSGFFSVTALMPGTYTVSIESKDFAPWKETGILINQGDARTVPSIKLSIGGKGASVTVISGQDAEIPLDTAEISTTLNNELVDSAVLTGRNAAELIKMMPGIVFNNGGGAGSAYNSQVTGTNNGPAGAFSANGTQPNGSTSVILDGANLIDPGNAGTQIANINQDMTDSVKYLSASYGAEYAKGPAILQAFGKSGGQKFHGEGYLYARNTAVGYANDWNNKNQELSAGKPNSISPASFYYVGGNVGGPVLIPKLNFNKNRDKLFFWGGYEYEKQLPYNSPININVPTSSLAPTTKGTPGQLDGDFNNIGVPANALTTNSYAYSTPCNAGSDWQGCSAGDSPWAPSGGFAGGATVPNLKSYFDPSGLAITNLIPLPNQIPTAANSWNNFVYAPVLPQNRWEVTGKATYSLNESNKIWGSYAYQTETDQHPVSIWWVPGQTVPYPGKPVGKETANVYLLNFTHVFNATSTNEFVFAYAKFINDVTETDPAAASSAALSFPAESVFGSSHIVDQIPNFFDSWAGEDASINTMDFNSGIYGPHTFGKTAKAPSVSDTFTKIVGTNSIKAGFYWDTSENLQANSTQVDPGFKEFDVSPWGANSTSNIVLDRLLGRNAAYYELSSVPIPDIIWHQWSLWAQDSWKLSRKLTINAGLRADHEGQWYDSIGDTQVWDPSSYVSTPNPPQDTGILWHKLNSKIPTSGLKSPLFYYDPRLGVAYDVFGTGNTVVRAGFGTYRYQLSSNDASAAMNGPLGSFAYTTPIPFYGYHVSNGMVATNQDGTTLTQLTIPTGVNQVGASISVDAENDNKVPYSDTYSFGIAQALPAHTVVQASYVGSATRNQLLNGNVGISKINPVPVGAFFKPDPLTGVLVNPAPVTPGGPTFTANDYRLLHNYQAIALYTHGGYSNYNSLQIAAQKQSGNLFLFTNFTFGKVLGTRDGSNSNGQGDGNVVDPFNLANNYAPLAWDHTKVLNVSFSYKLPSPIHGNTLLALPINGWQLSSYTTYQDGSNLQSTNPVLNATYCTSSPTSSTCPGPTQAPFTLPTGQGTTPETSISESASTWFGTNEFPNALLPLLLCDPRHGLKSHSRFNPNCFASPTPPSATSFGTQGPWVWPYLRNPPYFGSDMAVFKAFRVNESQRAEIRVSATNWLNHPNGAFNLAGNSDNKLQFNGYSSSGALVTNSNESTTGIPTAKQGYRWIQFAAKYYF